MSRFVKLSKEGGFSGSILPGISVSRERHLRVTRDGDTSMGPPPQDAGSPPGSEDEEGPDEGNEGDDDDVDRLGSNFTNILRVSSDTSAEAEAS
jgi:hypothetical protein